MMDILGMFVRLTPVPEIAKHVGIATIPIIARAKLDGVVRIVLQVSLAPDTLSSPST
jgi:hypothetical protein